MLRDTLILQVALCSATDRFDGVDGNPAERMQRLLLLLGPITGGFPVMLQERQ